MAIKNKKYSGADQHTPSKSQYFSWINSTNEGSTEYQTMVNLDFFAYMQKTYGMKLDIYAWDAGNLDGAEGTYETPDSPKIKTQYPGGYAPIVEKARGIGTRLGVWAGLDGYGDTPESEEERREIFVKLCRDYNFALFKFDGVCGNVRKEKREAFMKTLIECRKSCPDLIVLNHRNQVGKAKKYITTTLWQGRETYVDVLSKNDTTAPHHRAFAFTRGLTPFLNRLKEDHGVCISSFLDYFEDELIVQAFGRCLILAPEIYGNPWFLRDDELPTLARIFNLHKRYADILVNGKRLPSSYGKYAVSRGDKSRRFICLSNPEWKTKAVTLKINSTLGLKGGKRFAVIKRFPYESLMGVYNKNDTVTIEIMPFRAALVEVVDADRCEKTLSGAEYVVLHENEKGEPDAIKVLRSDGEISSFCEGKSKFLRALPEFDHREQAPIHLGSAYDSEVPADDRRFYETAMFSVSNDSLERQSVIRSGDSGIEVVNVCRDAFFDQKTYLHRGCDSAALFDDNEDTFFDAQSLVFRKKGFRIDGGCLRVDMGASSYIDEILIEYFEADSESEQFPKQHIEEYARYSVVLSAWNKTGAVSILPKKEYTAISIVENVHNQESVKGKLMTARYSVGDTIRYFELNAPPYRIHSFKALAKGELVRFPGMKANNLMAPYECRKTKKCKTAEITLPQKAENKFLACAIKGQHGAEGVYVVAEYDGKLFGAYDRASAFPANVWEHLVMTSDSNYTYYVAIPEEAFGKKMKIHFLFNSEKTSELQTDVFICDKHIEREGIIMTERDLY